MYYAHFGLNQPPFKITPDTRLFFPGANRGAVLQALVYAIVNGEGIVKVVGEVGSGKTMLCRMLEVELPENVEVVYLANPSLAPEHLPHAIAIELKLPVSLADDRLRVMQALQEYLLRRHAEGRRVVVFIEEAQRMPVATLEELRLLSNLETGQDKLLQIVLFGQPELERTLARHEIRQLRERITYSFELPPFRPDEVRDYLYSRLRASGFRGGEVFTPGAIRLIGRFSEGLVRRINILADKSLLAAYAENASVVTGRHVWAAAKDSRFERKLRGPAWAAALLVVAAGAGALWWRVREAPPEGLASAPTLPADGAAQAMPTAPAPPGLPRPRPEGEAEAGRASEFAGERLPRVALELETAAALASEDPGGELTTAPSLPGPPEDPVQAQLLPLDGAGPVLTPLLDLGKLPSLRAEGANGATVER